MPHTPEFCAKVVQLLEKRLSHAEEDRLTPFMVNWFERQVAFIREHGFVPFKVLRYALREIDECCLCGHKAFYRVNTDGYCEAHKSAAQARLRGEHARVMMEDHAAKAEAEKEIRRESRRTLTLDSGRRERERQRRLS